MTSHSSPRISFKEFFDQTKARLSQSTKEELESFIETLAFKIPLEKRDEFLKDLQQPMLPAGPPPNPTTKETSQDIQDIRDIRPPQSSPKNLKEHDKQEKHEEKVEEGPQEILSFIKVFKNHLKEKIEDPRFVTGPGLLNQREEFLSWELEEDIHKLEFLLDRVDALFDSGNFAGARICYEMIWRIFKLKDTHGECIGHFYQIPLNLKKSLPRYFCSVIETEKMDHLCLSMWNILKIFHKTFYHHKFSLVDLFSLPTPLLSSTKNHLQFFLENFEQFLIDEVLAKEENPLALFHLRQLTYFKNGPIGLKNLVENKRTNYPRVHFDYLQKVYEEKNYLETLNGARKALQILDPNLPLCSSIAELGLKAALHLKQSAPVKDFLWQQYYSRPTLHNFLEIGKYFRNQNETSSLPEKMILYRKATERLEQFLGGEIRTFSARETEQMDDDQLESCPFISQVTLAHVYLIGLQWDKAFSLLLKNRPYHWHSPEDYHQLILAFFMTYLQFRIQGVISLPMKGFLENALFSTTFGEFEKHIIPQEYDIHDLKKIYLHLIKDTKDLALLPRGEITEEKLLEGCLNICKERISYIERHRLKTYFPEANTLGMLMKELYC